MTGSNLLAGLVVLVLIGGLAIYAIHTVRATPKAIRGVLTGLALVLGTVPAIILAFGQVAQLGA